jgi:hypothetical protein
VPTYHGGAAGLVAKPVHRLGVRPYANIPKVDVSE